ncbi:hypothetical protein ABIF34_002531 [Bradyrhizobium japonicum]
MIGEAASVAVAEKAGAERSQHHADEGRGDESRVLGERRKAGLQRHAQHGPGDIDVEAVEKHADADQQHDAAVEWPDRQPIKTAACVHRCRHIRSPLTVILVDAARLL